MINVCDYGALGDGTTDDSAAFQDAIDAAVAALDDLTIPSGHYVISTPLTCNGPVTIHAEGGEVTANSNGGGFLANKCSIKYTGPIGKAILTFEPDSVGDIIIGGGIVGYLDFEGSGLADYAVHLNNTKFSKLYARARKCRIFGFRVSSRKGSATNFSMENKIDVHYIWGSNASGDEAWSGGLLLEGNGSNVPATQQIVERCDTLVYNGNGLQINETDNAQIIETQTSVQSPGTGRAVFVRNVGAQPSNHNVFSYCVGKVYIEDGIIGTTFLQYNTETGGIASASANWHGELVDYVTGRRYKTPTYQMRRSIEVPVGSMNGNGGAVVTDFCYQWPCIALPNASTPNVGVCIPKPADMDAGWIESIDLMYGTNGAGSGYYRLQLTLSAIADDNISQAVTPEFNATVSVPNGSQYQIKRYTFALDQPFSRGNTILARVKRLADDANDTCANEVAILGLRINYRSTGPNSAGGGTYAINPNF